MIQRSGHVATTTPLTIESTINKRHEVEGRGGATGRRHNKGQGHAHTTIKQITRRGGVVGDDDDDDNDDDGGCGGRDGHHRMRKGRGHDDRTNTTIK
jgi:hypothetical protein